MKRTKQSIYMEWAKTRSSARFNLATSGLTSLALADFPVRLDQLELTAPGGYGYAPLLEGIARHAGVPVECVVTAAGTSMANHLAMATVLEPGDEILIEEPAYGPLLDVADYLGARVRRLPRRFENAFDIDPDDVARLLTPATRLIVLTNLHNPTGALIPGETLRRIGQLAQARGALVLVDEVYLEMLFDREQPSAFSLGETFIVTSSLTKIYGLSGLRCGWILAAPTLAQRMWRLNDLYGANAAHAAERLSTIAFDHLPKFRERARERLAANRPLLDAFLDARDDLDCLRPLGGTVAFPKLRAGEPARFFALLRDKYETSVVPGALFEMPNHFRIGIGGESTELIAGLERLGAALAEFRKSQ